MKNIGFIIFLAAVLSGALQSFGQQTNDSLHRVFLQQQLWQGGDHELAINENPSWKKIAKALRKKYPQAEVEQKVLDAKIEWYSVRKDYVHWSKYGLDKLESSEVNGTDFVSLIVANNFLYGVVFLYCDDQNQLRRAALVMEKVLDAGALDEQRIDTYANLLYKSGQRDAAIKEERRALEISKAKNDANGIREFSETLGKMEQNLPTWIALSE